MSTLSATTEQIQPTLLTRLAAHAQRTGKTVNALLQELLDEREAVPYPPDARLVATRVPLDD